jgi:hypothetical protein
MSSVYRLTALGLATAVVACVTGIETHHEYDPNGRFGAYTTFAWITEEPLLPPSVRYAGEEIPVSPMLEQEIRSAIERNLVERGYEKRSDPDAADLVMSFSLGTRERVEVDSYPAQGGYHYGRRGPPSGWVSDVYQYTEGTLAIDLFDGRTDRAVWHGWATRQVDPSTDPAQRRKRVDQAVDAILAQFPQRRAAR